MSEVKEVADELIGFKIRNIWPTIKGLTIRPGQTIRRYFNNDHLDLVSPIAYYGMVVFFVFSLQSVSGINDALDDVVKKSRDVVAQTKDSEMKPMLNIVLKVQETIVAINKNDTLRTLVYLVPLLFLRWLFFKKYIKSFKAHAWFVLYTSAHMALATSIYLICAWYLSSDPMSFFANQLSMVVASILPIAYIIWASKQFYEVKLWQSLLRNILLLVSTSLLLYIILGIVYLITLGMGIKI